MDLWSHGSASYDFKDLQLNRKSWDWLDEAISFHQSILCPAKPYLVSNTIILLNCTQQGGLGIIFDMCRDST